MNLILLWSGLIVFLMATPLPAGAEHWLGRTDLIIHFALYAILGGVSRSILQPAYQKSKNLTIILLLSSMIFVPEFIQGYVPTREIALLDLLSNTAGLLWGLAVGSLGKGFSYLLSSGGLLASVFLFNFFKDSAYRLLFKTPEPGTLTVSLFIPISGLLIILLERDGTKLIRMAILFVIFLMGIKNSFLGTGFLLGAISLVGVIISRSQLRNVMNSTLHGSIEILSMTGFALYLVKCAIGTGTFLTQGGTIAVGIVLISGIIHILLSDSLKLAQFSRKFVTANRTQPDQ